MNFRKFVLSVLLISNYVFAHQFFPMEDNNGKIKVGFWADTHWGQYQINKIFGVTAKDKNGKNIKAGYDYQNAKIFVDKKPAIMTIMYDFGYYTFTKDGKHYSRKRSEITDITGANEVTATRHIYKMGKTIFKYSKAAKKPLGMKLEVVPMQNPLKLSAGDSLKVRVFFDGKPISNVGFEDQNGDIDGVQTNKDGYATIKLSKAKDGLQIIGAGLKKPYNLDMYGDILHLTATLSFKSK